MNSGIGTVFSALGEQSTVDLLEHAFVLPMINLYVVLGTETVTPVDGKRFATLGRDVIRVP